MPLVRLSPGCLASDDRPPRPRCTNLTGIRLQWLWTLGKKRVSSGKASQVQVDINSTSHARAIYVINQRQVKHLSRGSFDDRSNMNVGSTGVSFSFANRRVCQYAVTSLPSGAHTTNQNVTQGKHPDLQGTRD